MKKFICSKNTIEIILVVLFCLFFLWLNVFQITTWLKSDMKRGLSDLEKNMLDVSDNNNRTYDNYELVQKHITRIGAWYLGKREDPYSADSLNHAKDLLEAKAVYIIAPDGNLISGSDQVSNDKFGSDHFKLLRIVSPVRPLSEVVQDLSDEKASSGTSDKEKNIQEGAGFLPEEIDKEKEQSTDSEDTDSTPPLEMLSYYSYYMDPGHILVVCSSYADFAQTEQTNQGAYDLVSKTRYGTNGFYICATTDGDVLLTSEEDADNKGAEDLHLPADRLSDGYSGLLSFQGKTYYSCIRNMKMKEKNYLICLLPIETLLFSIFIVGLSTVAVVFISLLIMKYYVELMLLEPVNGRKLGEIAKSFRYRLLILTIACVCATAAVNIYFRSLYNYSSTISQDVKKTEELTKEIYKLDHIQEDGSEIYRKAVRIFTRTGGAAILEHFDHTDSLSLSELADVLGADHILVYDKTGTVTKSDLNFTGLTLSENPKDMSHEFWWIIRGYPLLIQEQADAAYLPDPYYYSGVPLTDGKGNYYGMVQLAIPPSLRKNLVATTSLSTILSSYEGSDDTFSFVVDKDKKIVYSPYYGDEKVQTKDLGFADKIFEDNVTGFFKKADYLTLGCSRSVDKYQVIVGTFTDTIPLYGVRTGFIYALPGILAEILYFFFLMARINHPPDLKPEEKRFFFKNRKQEVALEESRLLNFLKYVCIAYAAFVTLIVFAGSVLFKEGTPGYYIFVYPWSGSFNIFTVTRCINYFCIVALGIFLLIKLLMLLATLLPSRQETVVRLILSFIRYATVIGALFFCMTLLGVPTASLLLSAGALTAIFSMGAQSTVADILAGLFIIFEGSFKVGDMITVDDWHGQVEEIGIRNTTIRDLADDDVKIMNNSTIKKVINCSTYLSRCAILIGIEYGMDLRELEAVVEKEKETIEKNLHGLAKDFAYLGVEEFADSAVILKFRVRCRNQDFVAVKRALRREVKLMFDRNNIQVPFPQLVLHKGTKEDGQ